jgi:hypothetical protein
MIHDLKCNYLLPYQPFGDGPVCGKPATRFLIQRDHWYTDSNPRPMNLRLRCYEHFHIAVYGEEIDLDTALVLSVMIV